MIDTKGLTIQEFINFYQRYIIVHSKLYYFMDTNIISDRAYDEKCRMLVWLKERYPEEWRNSEYFQQFGADYVGNTGCDLLDGLTERQLKIIDSVIKCIYVTRGMDTSLGRKKR